MCKLVKRGEIHVDLRVKVQKHLSCFRQNFNGSGLFLKSPPISNIMKIILRKSRFFTSEETDTAILTGALQGC
jgi:hypothetical protein